MDKIEDIEIIDLVMLEESKPINKVGIGVIRRAGQGATSTATESGGVAGGWNASARDTTCAISARSLDLLWDTPERHPVWRSVATGTVQAGAGSVPFPAPDPLDPAVVYLRRIPDVRICLVHSRGPRRHGGGRGRRRGDRR